MTRASRLAARHRDAVTRGVRLTRDERLERLRWARRLRRQGWSLADIGWLYGISAERVRQLLKASPR